MILLAACILLPGCRPKDQPVVRTDIHEGTDGLALGFAKGMPPDDITDRVTFPIGVEMRNKGTADIEDGIITLINYYPEEMVMRDESKTKMFDIEGKSVFNPDGGYDLLAYTIENRNLAVRQRMEQRFLFKVQACYQYRTSASVEVCIKPRTFGFSFVGDTCDVKDIKLAGGQGAPVAVTKVEQAIVPDTDDRTGTVTYSGTYKILIENVGKGYIAPLDSYRNACTTSSKKENLLASENVQVELGDRLLECTPIQQIKDTNTFFTVCSAELGELRDSYASHLVVTIDYGYISPEIEKTVFVKKITQDEQCESTKCLDNRWGVCELYGGENIAATPSCGINQKCCYESAERCSREFHAYGYSCMPRSSCRPDSIMTGYCPGGTDIVCCIAG